MLLSIVIVWTISEFLNTAISYLLGPQLIKCKAILNRRGCGYFKSVGEQEPKFLLSASLNKGPRNSSLIVFLGLGEGEVIQRLLGLQSYPVFLILLTRHGMVYRFLTHFKDYLLMFSDTYPISRNSGERISTVNYILSIFGTEQAILM